MIVSKSLLSYDINKIIDYGSYKDIKMRYSATIHSPYQDINIRLLKFVEVKRDYNNSIGDDIRVCFIIKASEYMKSIYYYKDNLEMTLGKSYGSYNEEYVRYKCYIVKDEGETLKQNLHSLDDDTLDKLYPIEMEVQLVEKSLYALSGVNTEGTYQNEKLEDILYSEYSQSYKYIDLGEENEINLDIVKLDNKNLYGNILIPSGTKFMNLATYLQDGESYGLYNGGVGTYFQRFNRKQTIFMYPLFDPKRYDDNETKLQIFQDKSMKSGLDITFLQDGDVLKIIPRYETSILDMGESGIKSQGDTIVIGDTDNNSKSFRNTIGDDLIGDSKKNVKVMGAKENKDGVASVMYVGNTNNPYKYRTQLLRNSMAIYNFKWDNSDIDLIYPGMPCAVIFEDGRNEIVTLKGVVQGVAEIYLAEHKRNSATITVAVMSEAIYRNIESNYDSNIQ